MLFKTLLLAGLAVGGTFPALAHDCQPYQPEPVTLTGEITLQHGTRNGPKGVTREDYYVLTLPQMICVAGGSAETDEDVESIAALQLKLPPGVKPPLGRRVAVTGTLFHSVGDGHTDVLLTYDSAKPAP
ncbi:hypothetical protein [Nitrospirillum pindoramense]|uniref:DUF4431 domain-containing protein n=1 Tax=Nitrospirillum amazonense TaxID=28077 RepID=A0A560GUD6_9PROT|nr:hypothetical protein [Nitrospirillum amazonense]TWB37646.1 hypothetical protein FBZ90_114135 [Nitrospirillum amazonense]